jgi:hypothetical protein
MSCMFYGRALKTNNFDWISAVFDKSNSSARAAGTRVPPETSRYCVQQHSPNLFLVCTTPHVGFKAGGGANLSLVRTRPFNTMQLSSACLCIYIARSYVYIISAYRSIWNPWRSKIDFPPPPPYIYYYQLSDKRILKSLKESFYIKIASS